MQTVVNDALAKAVAGGLYGINHNIIGRNNYSKQLFKVAPDADDTTTTVTINSTAFTFTETGAAENKAYIAEYLATAINAGAEPVTAYYTTGNDYLTVEADVVGTAFTCTGTASCTVTEQIGNAAAIDFGLFVCQDLLYEDVARVPIVATDITNVKLARGIVCHDQAIEQFYQSAGGEGYGLNVEMSIVKEGMIWVVPETAMAITDDVYARFTVSGATKLGGIRNDADTAKAAIIPTARVIIPSAAAGLCLVEINLP